MREILTNGRAVSAELKADEIQWILVTGDPSKGYHIIPGEIPLAFPGIVQPAIAKFLREEHARLFCDAMNAAFDEPVVNTAGEGA